MAPIFQLIRSLALPFDFQITLLAILETLNSPCI